MGIVKADTIGAFNEYLSKLKKDSPSATLSLTLFDHEIEETITNQKVMDIAPLTEDTYVPRGMTALYDGIGKATASLQQATADNKILVILTDGQENSSVEYRADQIKKSLEEKQEKNNWLVTYLGANQDAFAVGGMLGVHVDNSLNFNVGNMGQTMSSAYGATQRFMKSGNVADSAYTTAEREAATN
jgi:hypothetical protein